jgi:hypothetical protein
LTERGVFAMISMYFYRFRSVFHDFYVFCKRWDACLWSVSVLVSLR